MGTQSFRVLSFNAVLAVLTLVVWTSAALAHRIDESYIYFQITEEALTGRIEVTPKDLAQAFAFEGADRLPTKDEIAARADEIFAYFAERLLILSDGRSYPIRFTDLEFMDTEVATFALLSFEVVDLTPVPARIDISYDFLFSDADPDHLGFALIESNTRTGVQMNESHISLTFGPGMGPQTLNLSAEGPGKVFAEFMQHGVWHVWHGIDHLLFLAGLLMTATMTVRDGRWTPTEDLQGSLRTMVGLVIAFTVGHLLSLSLVSFGVMRLSYTAAAAAIAGSIALVAVGNLAPQLRTHWWPVILLCGFGHGFGYVSVLPLLGTDVGTKTIGLLGFHVGLAIGQLAIVLIALPILYLLCHWRPYRQVALRMGSVALIAVAAVLFAERAYNFLGPVRQTLAGLVG